MDIPAFKGCNGTKVNSHPQNRIMMIVHQQCQAGTQIRAGELMEMDLMFKIFREFKLDIHFTTMFYASSAIMLII